MSFTLILRPTQRAAAQRLMFNEAHESQKSTRITGHFGVMKLDDGLTVLHCLQN